MCRAMSDPCPRRCVENVELRRARQNNYYARTRDRTAPSGLPDNPPTHLSPDITPQQVTEAVERAREALKASEPTYPYPENPDWPKPGARFTQSDWERGGWEYTTEEGTRMEEAVRQAGAAVASRAEVLTADRMAEVGRSPELLEYSDDGFESAQEFKEFIEAKSKSANSELDLARRLLNEGKDEDGALEQRWRSAYEEARRYQAELGRVERGQGAYDMAVARIRSQGYLEALAEQRSMGPTNGIVEVHPDSSKKAVARLEQALSYYPTDWIEADKTHKTRYTSTGILGEQEHTERIPMLVRDAKTRTRTTMMGGKERYEERAFYSNAKTLSLNVPVEGELRKTISGKARVPKGARVEREYWELKLYGNKWVEFNDPDPGELPHYEEREREGSLRRRKDIVQDGGKEKRNVVATELVVGSAQEGCVEPGVSTAIHEYGHRAERVRPRVNDLMHAFIARRTTDPESGQRHGLEALAWSDGARALEKKGSVPEDHYDWNQLPRGLGSNSCEFTRSDGFADRYIGKQTSDESSEAFTMGMESLFAGRNGGLVGDGGHRADHEHRDLLLGTLATI